MLDKYGDEIEADLKREYQVNLLDFYRGTLSARLLGVYVRQLSPKSSLVAAMNDGPVWSLTDHLIADVWKLWANVEHPERSKMEFKAKSDRAVGLKAKFQRLKRRYGLESTK